MGCSISACPRPATRIASYRLPGPRGITWRAYGFCDEHEPPEIADGLVYRLGRPPSFSYDLPMAPVLGEIYLLLGAFGFALWCVCMWRCSRSLATMRFQGALVALHLIIVAGLWHY